VTEFIHNHDRVYMIEMNTDGQMRQLLQIEHPDRAARIGSIRRNNGLPLTARWIVENLMAAEEK
jgi:2-oxoglutarate ferredoxin oxidoreductase subunit alpha